MCSDREIIITMSNYEYETRCTYLVAAKNLPLLIQEHKFQFNIAFQNPSENIHIPCFSLTKIEQNPIDVLAMIMKTFYLECSNNHISEIMQEIRMAVMTHIDRQYPASIRFSIGTVKHCISTCEVLNGLGKTIEIIDYKKTLAISFFTLP